MKKFTITTEHVRAARMFLGWNQTDLARKSGVSLPTIKRLEAKPGPFGGYPRTIAAIRRALEYEGIRFLNGDAPGVQLYKTTDKTGIRFRRFTPVVVSRASKPVKAVKKARAKKTRVYRANRLK